MEGELVIYHILIKRWKSDEDWKNPMFPKCSSDVNYLIHDAEDLKHLYHAVGVFDNEGQLVREI